MPYVTSVNGSNSARMESPEVTGGVLVPRIRYVDSKDISMLNGDTIYQGLNKVAHMTPVKISDTDDDYLLVLSGGL